MRHAKVKNFESKLEKLFDDDERIATLLSQEKSSRGVDQKQLVFVGLSDVSAQTFCSMKAVLRARESETMYFSAYLRDRLWYANKLKLLDRWPRSNAELLQAGKSITFDQVEAIERKKYGNNVLPDETSEVRTLDDDVFEFEIEGMDTEYAKRGRIAEFLHAERYYSFRWNFPYERYVFLGVPDGVTNDFVYEFKSGAKARWRSERMKEAAVQADLYGHFYKKTLKRIQVYTSDDGRSESNNSPVDENNAIKYLKNFVRVDSGEMPRQPYLGKCRSCDFVTLCPVYLSSTPLSRLLAHR